MKKRNFICMVLIIALVISMIMPISAPVDAVELIAQGTYGDNLTWTLDEEGVLRISGEGDMKNAQTSIANVSYYAAWYEYLTDIEHIIVEEGITSIGDCAFDGCIALQSVELPDSVTSIGNDSFVDTQCLFSIDLPDGLTEIGTYAFQGSGLKKIVLPENIHQLERTVFSGCIDLETVVFLSKQITNIDYQALDINKLKKVYFAGLVENIDPTAFSDNTTICITASDNITISDEAYQVESGELIETYVMISEVRTTEEVTVTNSSSIDITVDGIVLTPGESIVSTPTDDDIIPDDIEETVEYSGTAGENATWVYDEETATLTFSGEEITYIGCNELVRKVKHIVFEEGVVSIDDRFGYTPFTRLETVTLPSTLESVYLDFAYNSRRLTSITIPEENEYYASIDGNFYIKEDGKINELYRYAIAKEDTTYTFPEETTSVSLLPFKKSRNLKEIILPETVKKFDAINKNAEKLEKVIFLNPDCEIDRTVRGFTICSYSYSAIEEWCIKMNFPFEKIDVPAAESISVVKNSATKIWEVGRKYNPRELELEVLYEDGTTAVVDCGYEIEVDTSEKGMQTATVTYGGATTTYEVEVRDIPEEDTITIYKNVNISMDIGELFQEVYFTPEDTAEYKFEVADGGSYLSGVIEDMEGNRIFAQNGYNSNFSMKKELEEGKTYVIRLIKPTNSVADFQKELSVTIYYISKDNCNHTYEITATALEDCTKGGYHNVKCTKCKQTSTETIEPSEHEMNPTPTYIEANCIQDEGWRYSCNDCEYTEFEFVSKKLGHDFVITVVPPTETEKGYTQGDCIRCNKISYQTDFVPALGKTEETTAETPTIEVPTTVEPETTTTIEETTSNVSKDNQQNEKPAKTIIKKVKKKKLLATKVNLSVEKVDGATGYEISIYKTEKNAKNDKKVIKRITSTNTKIIVKSKKLKNKKKLYVRVRAYVDTKGIKVYGQWSNIKKVKIK